MTDKKIELDVTHIREFNRQAFPTAKFDVEQTFYYDETNNIRKFYVREEDFNASFTNNFILGGLTHTGSAPDLQPLIDGLKLQKTIKEVKLKHIAKGEFLECLKSEKLGFFLNYIFESDLYVHYSSLNVFYWSLVDIVDSAIVASESAKRAGPVFANHIKNDLYKLCRLEIESVIELFYRYEYPNIKQNQLLGFIEELTSLFDGYLDTEEFHFGLESLRQILKEAKKKGSLAFIMDEEDHVLINDLSQFYLRPLYTFKNSYHVFDNEDLIIEILKDYVILDAKEEIKNHTFEDSQNNLLIQCSDIFIGLMGKFTAYTNTNSFEQIINDLSNLDETQKENLMLLIDLIDKSHDENIGLIHSTDCYEELSKVPMIRDYIEEYWT